MQIPAKLSFAILLFTSFSMTPSLVSAETREPQVQIESKLVEVSNSQTRELGVDWNQNHSAETTEMRGLQHLGQLGNLGAANNAFDFKPIDFSPPQPAQPKAVSTPHVQTQNSEPAKMAAPITIPVVPQIQNNGINLTVVPEIQTNGMINMNVRPKPTPLTTTVQVPDGHTILLGGLIQENPEKNDKVPLLGTVPFVGSLFKNQSGQQDKKNLMIFVTPTLVQSSDN